MAVFGQLSGVGFNPIPTLDWNQFGYNYPLVLPFFSTANQFLGTLIAAPIILGFWYGNLYSTGESNKGRDRRGRKRTNMEEEV